MGWGYGWWTRCSYLVTSIGGGHAEPGRPYVLEGLCVLGILQGIGLVGQQIKVGAKDRLG